MCYVYHACVHVFICVLRPSATNQIWTHWQLLPRRLLFTTRYVGMTVSCIISTCIYVCCMYVCVCCMYKENIAPADINNKRPLPLSVEEQHDIWKRLKTHHTTPDGTLTIQSPNHATIKLLPLPTPRLGSSTCSSKTRQLRSSLQERVLHALSTPPTSSSQQRFISILQHCHFTFYWVPPTKRWTSLVRCVHSWTTICNRTSYCQHQHQRLHDSTSRTVYVHHSVTLYGMINVYNSVHTCNSSISHILRSGWHSKPSDIKPH